VFDDEKQLLKEGLEMAKLIASKSPIAVQGSKINLVYSRDHSVADGLTFMVSFGFLILSGGFWRSFFQLKFFLRRPTGTRQCYNQKI
jgi:hypothetical protein